MRIFFFSILLCLAAEGQTWNAVQALPSGMQVRVVTANSARPVQGKVDRVTPDELVVHMRGGPQTLRRDRVVAVSVRKEHRVRNILLGLGIGLGAGALIGYGVGHAQESSCNHGPGFFCSIDPEAGAAAGGLIGLVGGGVVGGFLPAGRWREVYRVGRNNP